MNRKDCCRTRCAFPGGIVALLLALSLMLLWGCGGGESSAASDGSFQGEGGLSRKAMQCRSSADGMALRISLYCPEGYDNAHSRPLILVLPGTPFPQTPPMGHALVARLESSRPAECPQWLLQQDFRDAEEFLRENLPVEEERVYVAGRGYSGLAFACREALSLAGAFLVFQAEDDFPLKGLPLRNLRNLSLWLDLSRCPQPPAAALELKERMEDAPGDANARFRCPTALLGLPQEEEVLLSAFAWLSSQNSLRDDVVWECPPGEAFPEAWIRGEARQNPAFPATLQASRELDSRGWAAIRVGVGNLRSFALQTDDEAFPQGRPIRLEIQNQTLFLSSHRGWLRIAREPSTGKWTAESRNPEARLGETAPPGGLRNLFRRPVVVVTGTLRDGREALWHHAAERLSQEWEKRTGKALLVRKDTQVSASDLEGRNVLLLGSPAENRLTEELLSDDPSFLRRLFQVLPPEERTNELLCALTLSPADKFGPGTLALVAVANDSDQAVNAAVENILKDAPGDYLLTTPTLQKHGFYHDWMLP